MGVALKKLLVALVLIGLALAAGVYGLGAWSDRAPPEDVYTLAPIEQGRLAEVVSATGLLQPRDTFVVGTELCGKVVAVLADFNQVVEEDDVLLRLDDRLARQQLKQAELGVELSRVALKKAEADREATEVAVRRERERAPEVRRPADIDLAESQLKSARVAVEAAKVKVLEAEAAQHQAELGLKLTTVRAPVLAPGPEGSTLTASLPVSGAVGVLDGASGRRRGKRSFLVLDRKVSLNQQIGPPAAAQLFTLAGDLERMQVHVQVVEGDVNKVTRGLPVEFTVAGGGDAEPTFQGRVEDIRLTPSSEHGAVYYKVIVEVRNWKNPATGNWHLRPGQTATVEILRRVHEQAWKVPAAALSFQPETAVLSQAAKAKLARWQDARDHEQWQPVWVVGADKKPWPILVRTGGTDGIQDAQFTEVLEWDSEVAAKLDPKDPATLLRLIIGMSGGKKSGLFNPPNIKF
jgi:HlyD family secretion protein